MKNLFGGRRTILVILLLIALPLFGISVSADANVDLANQYAPIFYFEGGETCYPVNISYHISNSNMYEVTEYDPEFIAELISTAPSANTLSNGTTEDFFLDNQKGTVEDDDVITHYQSLMTSLGYTIYSRVTTEEGSTVIQYWMFYAFNKGELNQHEGDWEMVQVVLSGGSPTSVMYSQHHGGQITTWDKVEHDGDNIKVYVARGSHANYLHPYSGGLTSDFAGTNGLVLDSSDYIEMLVDQDWLDFPGRWGEINSVLDDQIGRAGPPGPKFRAGGEMWNNPMSWGRSLQTENDIVSLLEWFLYYFVTIIILIAILSIAIIAFTIYRRNKKYGLGPRIVSIFYIDGANLKSIGNILCIVGIIVVIIALFQPWWGITYQISGNAAFEAFTSEGMADLITVDGTTGIQIIPPPFMNVLPVTSFYLPFAIFIAIGLLFFILATIGVSKSGKLGRKYIFRGIRVMIPIILLIIILMVMGSVFKSMIPDVGNENVSDSIFNTLDNIFMGPIGGEDTISVIQGDISGQVTLKWGLGLGGILLIIGGIILIAAGILEIIAKTTFFKPKIVDKTKKIQKPKAPTKTEPSKGKTKDITPTPPPKRMDESKNKANDDKK